MVLVRPHGPGLRNQLDLRRIILIPLRRFDFEVAVGPRRRHLLPVPVRMQEMLQSARIVTQAVAKIQQTEPGDIKCATPRCHCRQRAGPITKSTPMIHHFLLIQDGIRPPVGEVYQCIEAPQGRDGLYIVSDGSNKPIPSQGPGPQLYQSVGLRQTLPGRLLSDMIALIGTMDNRPWPTWIDSPMGVAFRPPLRCAPRTKD